MVGGDLLSHNVTVAVPSALEGLTAEFGMGSGVPPPLSPPTKVVAGFDLRTEQTRVVTLAAFKCAWPWAGHADIATCRSTCCVEKPNGRLVLLSSMCYHTSTYSLSTSSSSTDLQGKLVLREASRLRCFQRLSRPNVATQPCHWRDNWCTRDSFNSVLSY